MVRSGFSLALVPVELTYIHTIHVQKTYCIVVVRRDTCTIKLFKTGWTWVWKSIRWSYGTLEDCSIKKGIHSIRDIYAAFSRDVRLILQGSTQWFRMRWSKTRTLGGSIGKTLGTYNLETCQGDDTSSKVSDGTWDCGSGAHLANSRTITDALTGETLIKTYETVQMV